MKEIGQEEITRIRLKKRHHEVQVAKCLYNYIQDNYGDRIRWFAWYLLKTIFSTCDDKELNKFLSIKKDNFLLLQHIGGSFNELFRMLGRRESWTLYDCSDIIRLFCEVNELDKVPKELINSYSKRQAESHFEGQKKLRPFPTYNDDKKKGPVHRDRRERPEYVSIKEPYVDIGSIKRGIYKSTFWRRSVIAAIDKTFGLEIRGADISGTTTDSIYALQFANLDFHLSCDEQSVMQLLPLCTMVPQGHHTIIECAYPLSRHGIIDYHIGYYDTLLPKSVKISLPELSIETEHVIVWGSYGLEHGLKMESKKEIGTFKNVANLRRAYGFCVSGGFDSIEKVQNILDIYFKDRLDENGDA